jgi:hypothetical protein
LSSSVAQHPLAEHTAMGVACGAITCVAVVIRPPLPRTFHDKHRRGGWDSPTFLLISLNRDFGSEYDIPTPQVIGTPLPLVFQRLGLNEAHASAVLQVRLYWGAVPAIPQRLSAVWTPTPPQ